MVTFTVLSRRRYILYNDLRKWECRSSYFSWVTCTRPEEVRSQREGEIISCRSPYDYSTESARIDRKKSLFADFLTHKRPYRLSIIFRNLGTPVPRPPEIGQNRILGDRFRKISFIMGGGRRHRLVAAGLSRRLRLLPNGEGTKPRLLPEGARRCCEPSSS
jgi:hypothetical protein